MGIVLVSACLMGVRCRYDGGKKPLDCLEQLIDKHVLIPVCPEVLGGLPTPRVPAERIGDQVITKDGRNVTENYQRGAEEALRLARMAGCTHALLKERSPSCGCGVIYDGTFSKVRVDGMGALAKALAARGIPLMDAEDVPE